MKINAIDIKPGNVLEHQGKLWLVLKRELVQPGKGGAFAQVEMRDMRSGIKLNDRYRTQETVERVRLDEQEMQFLYHGRRPGDLYGQRQLRADVDPGRDDRRARRFPARRHGLHRHAPRGDALSVELPPSVTMAVVEADPVVRGQTASSSYKPGKLDNGRRVMIPPYIEAGTRIVVNTADGSYVERAKD